MRFGNDDVGSSFPPRDEHDESANAKFNLIPRTVTIAEGASSPTTSSCDSDSTSRRCTTWEDTRRHRRPVPVHQRERGPGRHGTARERLTGHGDVADTRRYFDEPGRYLVLCNFAPHFELFDMYGWVNVK